MEIVGHPPLLGLSGGVAEAVAVDALGHTSPLPLVLIVGGLLVTRQGLEAAVLVLLKVAERSIRGNPHARCTRSGAYHVVPDLPQG
jgi:hypothetical protein